MAALQKEWRPCLFVAFTRSAKTDPAGTGNGGAFPYALMVQRRNFGRMRTASQRAVRSAPMI
jgi:hypothetical protein